MFLLDFSGVEAIAWIVGFLLAFTVHEAAHAAAANYLGDPTAKFAGRLSLSPLKHLDPLGTLALFLIGIGWGKPVPINPANFGDPRIGSLLTALAGPLSNLLLALIFALPYNFLTEADTALGIFFQTIIYVNLVIMVFNLLPLPPLDGSRVVAALLPPRYVPIYESNGQILLILLIASQFLFNQGLLWIIISPAIDIMWAVVNLSTSLSG